MFQSKATFKARKKEQRPFPTGKITGIEQQARNTQRANVFLDGKFAFGLDWSLVAEYRLVRDKEITPTLALELQQSDQLSKARNAAIDYLAHKARTRKEVEDKLQDREYPEKVIEQVVSRLEEMGYLNDAKYAKTYTQSRLNSKGYGPQRIRMELVKRGVRGELMETAVQEVFEAQEDPLEGIREKARRKWEKLASETNPQKRRKKMGDFLMRRGFNYDDVRTLIDEFQSDYE